MMSTSQHTALDNNISTMGNQTAEGPIKPSAPQNDSPDNKAYEMTQVLLETMRRDSPFFENHPSLKLPKFEAHEISLDRNLGQGQFGSVFSIGCIQATGKFTSPQNQRMNSFRDSITQAPTETTHEELEMEDDTLSISSDEPFQVIHVDLKNIMTPASSCGRHHHHHHHQCSNSKDYMSTHIFRDGRPRYAVKQLRKDLQGDKMVQARTDLASEATFLMSLRHPNICTMRATIGEPGTSSFGIVMDRLVLTLQDKMMDWKKYEETKYRLLKKVLRHHQPSKEEQRDVQTQIYGEKLMAVYDIALALKHLADNRIIFRGLKPSNAGFDVHGALRLFDFGLAKELKEQDMTSPDMYRLTGMTGSPRYMAPEVIQSKDYGLSADIYSFAIVVWEVMSNSHAFSSTTSDEKLFEAVARKQKRPNLKKMITNNQVLPEGSQIREFVDLCWSHEAQDRPTIETVCERIHAEIILASDDDEYSSK